MDETLIRAKAMVARARARAAAHPIAALALATAAISLLFLAFPGIDVAVAGLFHRPGVLPHTEFPAEDVALLQSFRRAGMAVTRIAATAIVVLFVLKIFLPMLMRIVPTRRLLFAAASLALGPGLLVNAFFKEVWSRPRPSETVLFGGPWTFFPAWVPGGDCPTNCSFPSGEASGAAWLIALVFVVPPAWRRATALAVVVWTLAISLNRMAFGSHFLSDVTLGWGLTGLVVLACREAILVRLPEARVAAIESGLARAGDAVVGWVRRAGR